MRVAIAGSTGSIGTQTLDVISSLGEGVEVVALSVGSSVDGVVAQAKQWKPKVVVVSDDVARAKVAAQLPGVSVVAEAVALVEGADVVVNGVVGFAGLPVTVATLRAGKRLALANKESLIAAGPVVQPLRAVPGADIVPVDSEHCAIHQCLRASVAPNREVARLLLTASGGPFRGKGADELRRVTVEEALKHPTWSMGPKITVDSSTLMNKGLEVIEAHELFGFSYDAIDVVVHPQSIVHSMVEFVDGSTMAQCSPPNMKLPIALGMSWPERVPNVAPALDFTQASQWTFEPLNEMVFGAVRLARQVAKAGSTYPAVYNAANEEAVEAFHRNKIGFNQIVDVIERTVNAHEPQGELTLESVLAAETWARDRAVAQMVTAC